MSRFVNLKIIEIDHFRILKQGFILQWHYEFFDELLTFARCLFDFYLELELDDGLNEF
jgi:hypothetical protein